MDSSDLSLVDARSAAPRCDFSCHFCVRCGKRPRTFLDASIKILDIKTKLEIFSIVVHGAFRHSVFLSLHQEVDFRGAWLAPWWRG